MTTIAYDGKTIAADTQLTFGNIKSLCRKIYRFPEKEWIMACAGETNVEGQVLDFLRGKADRPNDKELKKFEAIVVNKEKEVFFFSEGLILQPVVSRTSAYGSGWQIAQAALHLGLPARSAVELASELDIYTNNIIDVYDIATDTIHQKAFRK
jgi:ATP-dependent protease HslVU (ClpYQ) peptidase subunit